MTTSRRLSPPALPERLVFRSHQRDYFNAKIQQLATTTDAKYWYVESRIVDGETLVVLERRQGGRS